MKIVVTGASGFIGREIVTELRSKNHEIISFVGLKLKDLSEFKSFVRVDVTDFDSLSSSCENQTADVVIHSAGLAHQFGKTTDEDFLKVNVKGTENISRLSVRLGVKHLILISSVAVYGNTGESGVIDETNSCNPKGIYAKSKFEAEKIATKICEEHKIALTILRPVTVIGENDRGNTARLIEAIDKRRFLWIGKGENRKSLIYKNDVAKACLQVLEKKTSAKEIFNVTGEALQMNFIVSEIARNLQRKILPFRISQSLLNVIFGVNKKSLNIGKISNLQETVGKWISNDVFSGELFHEKYGFQAETKISKAIRRQIQFYKQNLKTER